MRQHVTIAMQGTFISNAEFLSYDIIVSFYALNRSPGGNLHHIVQRLDHKVLDYCSIDIEWAELLGQRYIRMHRFQANHVHTHDNTDEEREKTA